MSSTSPPPNAIDRASAPPSTRRGAGCAAVPQPLRAAAPWLIVIAVASITGALTPIGEHVLPHSIRSMANSSGPWMLIDYVSVYLVRARGWRAAALGAVSFVVMDVVFFVVFEGLGDHYPKHYLAFWGVIAIAIGPIVGLAASWLRAHSPSLRAIAIAAPGSVLLGEGIYMLAEIPGESTVYAIASIIVGAVLFVALVLRGLHTPSAALIGVSLLVAGAAAFIAVYGLLPLVLDKVVP